MVGSKFELGTRVVDADGYKATVRYIGPVAAAKNKAEIWLGVQWDCSDRGKHDGSCVDSEGKLHRYFECSNGTGSFVKFDKVSVGKTLCEALVDRYVEEDAPELVGPDAKVPDAYIVTAKGHKKSIEFFGEKRIRKWQQLAGVNKVAVRNESVSSLGERIEELASHFTEIDLQDNLLYRWEEISELATRVPSLQTLLLHGNKLQQVTVDIVKSLQCGCFQGLKVLALNSCGILSWSGIQLLEPFMPNIEELYLANNVLTDLSPGDVDVSSAEMLVTSKVTGFGCLRLLDISYCGLTDWGQVLAVSGLSCLQELMLDGNPLARVSRNTSSSSFSSSSSSISSCGDVKEVVAEDGLLFHKLQRLSLSSTSIASWEDIDSLASYPCLSHLRLSHIPLFAGQGASQVRPIIIARMARLVFFNGSGVSPRERVDAEKSYLRSVLRAASTTSSASSVVSATVSGNDVSVFHPRFLELQARYVHDMLPIGRSTEGLTLAADIGNLTFHNMSTKGSNDPVTKKMPSTVTVARLRLVIKQMFGLEPHLQQLSLRVYKDALPTVLDDDQASLQYYGVIDGSCIYINEAKA